MSLNATVHQVADAACSTNIATIISTVVSVTLLVISELLPYIPNTNGKGIVEAIVNTVALARAPAAPVDVPAVAPVEAPPSPVSLSAEAVV